MPAKGVHRDASVPSSEEEVSAIDAARAPAGDPAELHAILVGDGDVPERVVLDTAWPGWSDGCRMVVAADGGARKALAIGLRPDCVVGDGDSLGDAGMAVLAAAGIPFDRVAAEKDESDLELAVLAAVGAGATRLTVLGALGGPRLDHALANAWLLAHPALAGCPTVLLDAVARVRLLDASSAPAAIGLAGRIGDLVSLFPFGEAAAGIRTEGLAYSLVDESLVAGPARGLSNIRTAPEASVSLRSGRLLVIETLSVPGDQR